MKNLFKRALRDILAYAVKAYFRAIPGGLSTVMSFAVNNDPNSMIGDFKNLYQESGLVNAVPNWMLIQDRFKFEEAQAGLGQYYVFGG